MKFEYLVDDLFRLDETVDELLFDGFESLCRVTGSTKSYSASPLQKQSLESLQDFALAQGVRWDPMQPAAGGAFSVGIDGAERHYRWHGLLPPIARDGLLLSVRRHRLGEFSLDDFIPAELRDIFAAKLNQHHPVFVMGPTGSGKTTFMVSALLAWAAAERVAILEQIPEVPRLSPRWIRLCAQQANLAGEGSVSLNHLIDELLRLRPDRMIIGELRREEIFAFKRALLAGHSAMWTTVHASSAEELPWRLAELGAASREEWRELLDMHGALVVRLDRQSPRFQGLRQFDSTGIISF